MPARVEERIKKSDDGAGGILEQKIRMPVRFDPTAEGGTPNGIAQAQSLVQRWLEQHPDCFPPVVIHITDGESTDGAPTSAMKSLTGLRFQMGMYFCQPVDLQHALLPKKWRRRL
jgi:hypothetical protein